MSVQTLRIDDWVPEQITNGTTSWRRNWRVKKAAGVMAWAAAKQAGWVFVPGRVRLTITYTFGVNRSRDTDNLYARSIGLVNGLKKEFFTDDDTEHLELVVKPPEVRKGCKSTEITLEGIG